MQYSFSIEASHHQFISIELTIDLPSDQLELQLPSWRPGRYELGNFAKNIKSLVAFNENGEKVPFRKLTKDLWQFDTRKNSSFKLCYKYYAAVLNAGSTYLDKSQLYVNPVNCCFYEPGNTEKEIRVQLNVPDEWKIACPIYTSDKMLVAQNFDELADSPFICSPHLQYDMYEVKGVRFHLWFNGLVKPDWKRLKSDFTKFTSAMLKRFLEFPTNDYHFLFQIVPYHAYHGVEHTKSTVITLGPSCDIFGKLYKELLGVSSHELYHTWNVKTIRPSDMMPYDFSTENYTRMGYLTEGVTTYMGDLMLLKSGVFSLDQFLVEFSQQFQRHFDNFGRFNYSVAESSFDTWLDGYQAGVPGRKVSIYTEGCLLAFITDVMLMKATDNKRKLDEVMRALYHNFAREGKGVSETDYQAAIENVAGQSFDWLFEQYVFGTKAYEVLLVECLDHLGLELIMEPHDDYSAAYIGFKTAVENGKQKVAAIYPGSNYDSGGGMIDDEIIGVNGVVVNGDLNSWLKFFDTETKTLTIKRSGMLVELILPEMNRRFYCKYRVGVQKEPIKLQIDALGQWRK